MKYWDYIVENLPNYHSEGDVLRVDFLNRYLEGQEVCDSVLDFAFGKSVEHTVGNAILVMQMLERSLMLRAMAKEQDSFARSILDVKGGVI